MDLPYIRVSTFLEGFNQFYSSLKTTIESDD